MDDTGYQESVEGIALVGVAGRFPGANTIEQFWQNLCDGVESIAFFSDEEVSSKRHRSVEESKAFIQPLQHWY